MVQVAVARVPGAPWWRRTARPLEPAEQAPASCRMDRQRWALADACKVAKPCVGKVAKPCVGEAAGPVLGDAAGRLLGARGGMAAALPWA